MYFLGPPGTRKTYIAGQLAKLLGAPFIILTASDNPESITGTTKDPGSFIEAISKPGMWRNPFVFIDEGDRIINKKDAPLQLFLPLIEPETKYFYSPYLGCNVDISHFCFILAGNSPLNSNSEFNKSALDSRIKTVKFDKVLPRRKKKIVYQMLEEIVPKGLRLNKGKYEKLLVKVDNCIKEDKNPGVRKLRLKVNDIVNKTLLEEMNNQD